MSAVADNQKIMAQFAAGAPLAPTTVTVVPANMGDLSAMIGSLLSQAGNARPATKA